jgi:hypothetical protein
VASGIHTMYALGSYMHAAFKVMGRKESDFLTSAFKGGLNGVWIVARVEVRMWCVLKGGCSVC